MFSEPSIYFYFLYLQNVPFDDRSSRVFQYLLPMFEPRLVLFVLAPAQLYLSNGIPTANQIVVANLEINLSDPAWQN